MSDQQNPVTETKNPRDLFTVAFGTVQEAERPKWPARGHLVITSREQGEVVDRSPLAFSVERTRELLKPLVTAGVINGDDAVAIEKHASTAGLPNALTRYDRLFSNREEREATQLTDYLTGTRPPQANTGPTAFVKCTGRCGLDNCSAYPTHGAFRLQNVEAFIAPVAFSTARAEEVLRGCVNEGVIDESEVPELKRQILQLGLQEGGIMTDEKPAQPDLILTSGHPSYERILDRCFGIGEPVEEGPRFCGCKSPDDSRHAHLHVFDKVSVEPGPIFTRYQAVQMVENGVQRGFFNEAEAAKLREEASALELPEGGEDDPRNKEAASINKGLRAMHELMGGDLVAMLQQLLGSRLEVTAFRL